MKEGEKIERSIQELWVRWQDRTQTRPNLRREEEQCMGHSCRRNGQGFPRITDESASHLEEGRASHSRTGLETSMDRGSSPQDRKGSGMAQ